MLKGRKKIVSQRKALKYGPRGKGNVERPIQVYTDQRRF
jgi:hypothetical protein